MMTAGKQIEEPIARIAQLKRWNSSCSGYATTIGKRNHRTIVPNPLVRLAYQVASKVDSRTILDVGGADQLVGMGICLPMVLA